jgi:hypothetical protein
MSLLAALLLAQAAAAPPPPGCIPPNCAVTMPPPAEFRFDNPALEVLRGRVRLEVTRRGQAAYAFQIALLTAIAEARGKPLSAPEWVIARRNLSGAARASAELAQSESDIHGLEIRAMDGGKGSARDRAEVAETAGALRATLIGDAARFAEAARRFAEAEAAAR